MTFIADAWSRGVWGASAGLGPALLRTDRLGPILCAQQEQAPAWCLGGFCVERCDATGGAPLAQDGNTPFGQRCAMCALSLIL